MIHHGPISHLDRLRQEYAQAKSAYMRYVRAEKKPPPMIRRRYDDIRVRLNREERAALERWASL